jgi:phytoene synthase
VNLSKSFAVCRRITSQAHSSFPLAFRVLPPAKRRAMDALYAFMRVTDDLADEPGETSTKRDSLNRWRDSLTAALRGEFTHPLHPALADTVARFAIDSAHLFAVIDGMEMDLEPVRFSTFTELFPYLYRVSCAVGLACVRIWGFRPGVMFVDVEPFSVAAGVAFQLTNILRDLGEDLSRGRVYLPEEELSQSPPESWRKPDGAAAFREMMHFQANRAHEFYRKAEPLDHLLSSDGRAIYQVMSGTYWALLREIEKREFDVFTKRVRVPKWRKGMILLSAWPVKWWG